MHVSASTNGHCPTCGSKLGAGAEPGRCPACLLRLALSIDAEEPESTEENDGLLEAPGEFGEYELVEQIGRGAMGVVFKARQPSLERFVALKVLDLAGRVPLDAAKRFRAEASAAAALRHPGIVTIHDVGVHQGRHYLAMDLVEGSTLAALVARGPFPAEKAAALMAEVADAVQCAHERGILHRDLKPTNILVDRAGRPHVADFGLAKRMGADADLTMPGQVMGSPNYMSPEQARGAPVGVASDVHALGAMLYHAVAGRPPFLGETITDTLNAVIHGEPVRLRLLVPGLPRDLATIVHKCLEKEPARRYASAREVAEDLRRFLRHEPILARPIGRVERVWRWGRRRPAVAGLTAATAVLLVAVAVGSPVAAWRIRAERERAEDNLYAADMNLAQQALTQSSRARVRALLERHRPGADGTDRRGFEWRYLWGKTQRDDQPVLQTLTGERHLVRIPGTTLIAAGSAVWDLEAPERPVFTLPEGSLAAAFDGTARELLASGRNGLSAWSVGTWTRRDLLKDEAVHAVELSADGRWMASGGTRLRLWEREGGVWRVAAVRDRTFKVWHNARTLTFSPDGAWLVTATGESWASRCRMDMWSVPALEWREDFPAGPGDVLSVAFTPDGRHLVAGCWNGLIRAWDFRTRQEVETGMRLHGFVTELVFSPDDPEVFATAASDRTVRLWNFRTREQLVAMQGPDAQIWAMCFAEGGRTLLTLEQQGRVARWDAGTRRRVDVLIERGPPTVPLGFSEDGRTLATIDQTGALRFWDVVRRREIAGLAQPIDFGGVLTRDFEIMAPAMARDLRVLAVGTMDGRVRLHDVTARTVAEWTAHAAALRNVAFSPDGATLATVADDGWLRLWDVRTRRMEAEEKVVGSLAPEDFNVPLVWSDDGRRVAVASATAISVLDRGAGTLERTMPIDSLIYSMRFAPGGDLVAAHETFEVIFRDVGRGRVVDRVHTSHQEGIYDVCFSPDGRTMATAVDYVKLWSVATRQEVSTLRGHERNIFAAMFSPDGNLLVSADYAGQVRLWPARPLAEIDGGGVAVRGGY